MKTDHGFSVATAGMLCVLLVGIVTFLPRIGLANNLQINNVSLVDAGGNQAKIQFDISWDNSWHESWTENGGATSITNWDAAWVFVKYRQSGGLWKHVKLETTGHTATGGSVIETAADLGDGRCMGVFLHRSGTGSGTFSCPGTQLLWDIAAEGLPTDDEIDLTVIGIEMVYIPEGAFYLGSGGTEINRFYAAPDTDAPYLVTSEAAITVGSDPGNLNATGEIYAGSILAAFPKGYAAFYCMKYEITEGQFVTFLNLLDPTVAASTYYPNKTGISRHTVTEAGGGGYETAAPDRAIGFLNGPMFLDYLDWAALRPMTELEFEKACRGPRDPWINEYVWGDTTATVLSGIDGVDGSGTETAQPAGANLHEDTTVPGPVRVGIFATASTSREQGGAGYYGVLNLGGNVCEVCVAAIRTEGRDFTGAHGDGSVYTSHSPQWPASGGGYAYGLRGTSYNNIADRGRTSDRGVIGARPFYYAPGGDIGGRGVHTAP